MTSEEIHRRMEATWDAVKQARKALRRCAGAAEYAGDVDELREIAGCLRVVGDNVSVVFEATRPKVRAMDDEEIQELVRESRTYN